MPFIRSSRVLAAVIALACCVRAAADPQVVYQDLQSLLSQGSEIVLTSNATYAQDFTPRYNVAQPPTYAIAVKPALVSDVQQVILYAGKNAIPFLATGRGHGYTTSLGKLQGGIDLDLGMFNSIELDTAVGTITIGGAVRSSDVAAALQDVGMELPVPQCPCVGYTGATLGGGIGPYSGLYGALSDSLVSAEVVTADGQILNVSQAEHSDLFYAIRGAGSNYGVATSLTYRTYPATNGGNAMNADMIFTGAQNESVWTLMREFAADQTKELSIGLSVRYNTDPAAEGIIITANFIYAGPQEAGVALIQPFLDLQPQGVNITTVLWKDIPSVADSGAIVKYGCTPGVYYVPYGVNLYAVDVPNLVGVTNYMNESMAANSVLQGTSIVWQQYSRYGFQVQSLESSAFPHRNVSAFIQVDGVYTDASQGPAITQFGREVRDMLQSGSGGHGLNVFVHFAHGDEHPSSWYSAAKLPGLRSLKNTYDPAGLFSWYNPVVSPPSS